MILRGFHLWKLEKLEGTSSVRHCDRELVIKETRIRTRGSGTRALTFAEIKHQCDAVTALRDPWDFGATTGVTST